MPEKTSKPAEQQRATGPEAERLTLSGNWQTLVKKALKKKKPADGWPEAKRRYRKPKTKA